MTRVGAKIAGLLALAGTLACIGPVRAEIAVESVGGAVGKLAAAPAAEIHDFFAGHTFKFSSRFTTQSYPFHGPSFVYFAPNGTLAVWTHRYTGVQGGKWEIGHFGHDEMLLCFDFDGWDEHGACVILESARTLIQERAADNVFNLKAGAAVHMVLRRNQVEFDFVARELGL